MRRPGSARKDRTNNNQDAHKEPLPSDLLDMEKELQKIGFKPVRNTAQRRAAAQIQGISQKRRQTSPAHLFRISSKASANSSRY
ncbi:hypothetical protein YC2023_029473 [Brassica napus]